MEFFYIHNEVYTMLIKEEDELFYQCVEIVSNNKFKTDDEIIEILAKELNMKFETAVGYFDSVVSAINSNLIA